MKEAIEPKPLANGRYLLEKFPGKGGWTYAQIPDVIYDKKNPFGWVKVKGSIDDYVLQHYKLMPMGNGSLFLPVRSDIRKKIKKEAGGYVKIVLYYDDTPLEIPDEIKKCFQFEPEVCYENYLKFNEGEQKAYLNWIYEAKTDETKAKRILEMMNRLKANLRLYD
jgi:hypothetical protein